MTETEQVVAEILKIIDSFCDELKTNEAFLRLKNQVEQKPEEA